MADSAKTSHIKIRELTTVADLERALEVEKDVWRCEASDVIPITLAVASRAAGSVWRGAFDGDELVGFAFAFPSFEQGGIALHSHTVGVRDEYQSAGVGYQLKLEQRRRALDLGIKKITWTFDPLRSRNAHFNFCKLGVISDRYEIDFYGSKSSSPLHSNSTDRLWVTWDLANSRVEHRLKGKDPRHEMLDALAHLEPLVRFNGDGQPAQSDLKAALARRRVAIEIPGDIGAIELENITLGREWRVATRRAFTDALKAGFVVREFCRSVRGKQGPGAYLLERET